MRIRKQKLFGCKLASGDIANRQPNNRSQVAQENEVLHFGRFRAATWHNQRLAP